MADHWYLSLDEVFAVEVPFRHGRLQQVLLLFEFALCLCDLLFPIKYLHLSYFNVTNLLLHLWNGGKLPSDDFPILKIIL